jgi:hypothetical protein
LVTNIFLTAFHGIGSSTSQGRPNQNGNAYGQHGPILLPRDVGPRR